MKEQINSNYLDIEKLLSAFPFEINNSDVLREDESNIILQPNDNLVNGLVWQGETDFRFDPCSNPDKVISLNNILLDKETEHAELNLDLNKVIIQTCTGMCDRGETLSYCKKHSREYAMNLLMQDGCNGSKNFEWYGRYMAKISNYFLTSPKMYHNKLGKLLAQELISLNTFNSSISRRHLPLSVSDIYSMSLKLTPRRNLSHFPNADKSNISQCNYNVIYNSHKTMIKTCYRKPKKHYIGKNFFKIKQKSSSHNSHKKYKSSHHKQNYKKILVPNLKNGKIIPSLVYLAISCLPKLVVPVRRVDSMKLKDILPDIDEQSNFYNFDINTHYSAHKNKFGKKLVARYGCKECAFKQALKMADKSKLDQNSAKFKDKKLFCFDCNVICLDYNSGVYYQ